MVFSRFLQEVFGAPTRSADAGPSDGVAKTPTVPPSPPFDYSDPRIPDTARGPIKKVLSLIGEIEKAAAAKEVWSPMLVEIHQLSEIHLPALVKSYIDIPAAHRAEIFRRTGRSASFLLNDGLEKMAERLGAMSLSLAQGNIDAFTSTMRFIETRYGADQLAPD